MQVTLHTVAAGCCMGHNANLITSFSFRQPYLILLGEIISLSSIAVMCQNMEWEFVQGYNPWCVYSRYWHQHATGSVSYQDPAAYHRIHLARHAPVLDSVVVVLQVQAALQSTGLSSDGMQVVLHHRIYDVQQIGCSLNAQVWGLTQQVLEAGVQDTLRENVAYEQLSKEVHHGRHLCCHLHRKNRYRQLRAAFELPLQTGVAQGSTQINTTHSCARQKEWRVYTTKIKSSSTAVWAADLACWKAQHGVGTWQCMVSLCQQEWLIPLQATPGWQQCCLTSAMFGIRVKSHQESPPAKW
jgi:hypothetical protein